MGIFDRFKKKKEEPKGKEQGKQPLTLQYRDGTVANIMFEGICEVEGKILHAANIEYIAPEGSFTRRSLLLEPITSIGESGEIIDATEAYYKWMADKDGTKESNARYSAVKGFFKQEEITEEKIKSNYIGNIAKGENGEYYRNYDESFREKYQEMAKNNREKELMEKQALHKANEENIKSYSAKMQEQGRKNMGIFEKIQQGVASQEEINEYYNAVHHKYRGTSKEGQSIGD